jgi:hypothetical protein
MPRARLKSAERAGRKNQLLPDCIHRLLLRAASFVCYIKGFGALNHVDVSNALSNVTRDGPPSRTGSFAAPIP